MDIWEEIGCIELRKENVNELKVHQKKKKKREAENDP